MAANRRIRSPPKPELECCGARESVTPSFERRNRSIRGFEVKSAYGDCLSDRPGHMEALRRLKSQSTATAATEHPRITPPAM